MGRPYIICHMETSMNSKIIGPFMRTPQAAAASQHYNETHLTFNSEAWLCGRVTMEGFTGGRAPDLDPTDPVFPCEDYVADPDAKDFVAVADPGGKLGWTTNTVKFSIRPLAHIIELLTERASDAYVSFLRRMGISYIFAGEDQLDLELAVSKLGELFGVKTLVVSGGASINGSFLNAGLIDEVSVVMSAVVDDANDTPTLFHRSPNLPQRPPVGFTLKSVETLSGEVIWMRHIAAR